MTIVFPDAIPTLGNTRLTAVAAVASLTAPKVATEIGAVGSQELSGHLYPEGWQPTGSTAKGTKKTRLASTNQLEVLNRTTYSLNDLQYTYAPQALDTAAGNEVKKVLIEGAVFYLVERIGLDADVAWAVGQSTIVHYVRLGAQIRMGDRTDENGEFFIQQSLVYINNGPVFGTTVA